MEQGDKALAELLLQSIQRRLGGLQLKYPQKIQPRFIVWQALKFSEELTPCRAPPFLDGNVP
ncbi:MAG: hypothetical protein ACPG4T_10535 [Nannocystaceae bacterium]